LAEGPVISNASPLISLASIGRLELLHAVFGKVLIPPAVEAEVRSVQSIPAWLVREDLRGPVDGRIGGRLGRGEAEALSLALHTEASLILLDDLDARKQALSLGLTVSGTAGVLIRAKSMGVIPEVMPILDSLIDSGLRVGPRLRERVLRHAGELTSE
jgi:predicted nucleic acid-binding protein